MQAEPATLMVREIVFIFSRKRHRFALSVRELSALSSQLNLNLNLSRLDTKPPGQRMKGFKRTRHNFGFINATKTQISSAESARAGNAETECVFLAGLDTTPDSRIIIQLWRLPCLWRHPGENPGGIQLQNPGNPGNPGFARSWPAGESGEPGRYFQPWFLAKRPSDLGLD